MELCICRHYSLKLQGSDSTNALHGFRIISACHWLSAITLHNNKLMEKDASFFYRGLRKIGIKLYELIFNLSPPGQNGHLFPDYIFGWIFVNEKYCILVKISLKIVTKGPIDNNPALVQIMTWRRISDKPLCEPMLICSTRGRWVKWQHHRKPRHKVSKVLYSLYEEQTAMWASFINSSPPGQNGRQFDRQHFQMHFHEWKVLYFDWNFTEVCS